MPDENDGLDITATVAIANSELEDFVKAIDSSLGDQVPGASAAKPADIVALVFSMQAQYPAAPYLMPDGTTVVASPWILAQAFSENGSDYIGPFERMIAKYGGV